jgi:uncharacterized membrane protein YidH (DUF202 family)
VGSFSPRLLSTSTILIKGVTCLNEKGRKRVVIGIVLVIVGALLSLMAYGDYLANPQLVYDSEYVMSNNDAFIFFVGISIAIVGFAVLAYVYVKIDKYKDQQRKLVG